MIFWRKVRGLNTATKNNHVGFTLVELMVVVAIIGILSAVAIPNFKKYQAKSKTSEAKLQLAAIYTNETTFMGDYDTYATCLGFMGYSVPAKGTYYAIGFNVASTNANTNAVNNGATGCDDTNFQFDGQKKVGGVVGLATDLDQPPALATADSKNGIACEVDVAAGEEGTEFIACAIGLISSDFAKDKTVFSFWSINQNKNLYEEQRGY